MHSLWTSAIQGFLRLLEPLVSLLVRLHVKPNTLTTVGTLSTIAGGLAYGMGHIRIAGIIIGLTAVLDVLDGMVARRSGQETVFGAFYDSTLDRVADGVVLGGLAFFYATNSAQQNAPMVAVAIAGIIGALTVSYARARAEGLGIDAKVGLMQRAERVIMLSVPQALFGLALGGKVLMAVVAVLAATSWITVFQRIAFVRRATLTTVATPLRVINDKTAPATRPASRRA